MVNRRSVLLTSTALIALAAGGFVLVRVKHNSDAAEALSATLPNANGETFEVTHTEDEWHRILTPARYAVLREEATEAPTIGALMGETSTLLYEHRDGLFKCAGCDLEVYSSEHKYESGTGWPSFWQAYDDNNIRTKADVTLGYPRTEVHCRRCGGHFGHIFDDGPQPTGKRHCLNGLALQFDLAV